MKPYTIKDIAKEAGVSITTVSRVLNDRYDVSEETRSKVQTVIERLRYVSNASARHLAGAKVNSIGLLLPGLGSGYATEIIRGVAEATAEAEYDLVLYAAHEPQGLIGKERNILSKLMHGKVDGMVVVLPRTVYQQLTQLWQDGLPIVVVDPCDLECPVPSVASTNFQGALDGTRYLLGLGHRRIGFVTGDLQVQAALDRLAGYRQALQDAKLPSEEALIYQGNFHFQSGCEAASTLMELETPPTAIFASNDDSALGAMAAIRDLGLSIPGDISILGFDDIPQAAEAYPALTTIHQPLVQIGKTAVDILLRVLNQEPLTQSLVELPTRLVIRNSCERPHFERLVVSRYQGS